MGMKTAPTITLGHWQALQQAAQFIRTEVFVKEQGIAPEDEWDADDTTALHAVLFDASGQPLGNARLLQPSPSVAKIGRMAVLKEARGHGYGAYLLHALVSEARRRGHKGACPRFCVNGLMAGDCRDLQRKRNDRKQRIDRPPAGGLQKA